MHQVKMAVVVPGAAESDAAQEFARVAQAIPFEDVAITPMPDDPGIYYLCRQLADREYGGGLGCSRFHVMHVGLASSGLALRFKRPLDEIKLFRQMGGSHIFMVPVPEGGDLLARIANIEGLRPLMATKTWQRAMPGMNCIICWRGQTDFYSLIPGDRFHSAEVGELTDEATRFINSTIVGR